MPTLPADKDFRFRPGPVGNALACTLLSGLILLHLDPPREAQALDDQALEVFQALDVNGDRRIDPTEFKTNKTHILFMRRKGKAQPGLTFEETLVNRAEFDAADVDKNGTLSSLEWITAPFTDFARADSDSDQLISMEEFEAFANAVLR